MRNGSLIRGHGLSLVYAMSIISPSHGRRGHFSSYPAVAPQWQSSRYGAVVFDNVQYEVRELKIVRAPRLGYWESQNKQRRKYFWNMFPLLL